MMKELLLKLKSSKTAKTTFTIAIYISIFFYVFSLPSFSGRAGYNIISYCFMFILLSLTLIATFVFSKFSFRILLLILPTFSCWTLIGTLFFSHQFRGWLTLVLLSVTYLTFYYSFSFLGNVRYITMTIVFAFLAFSVYFLAIYYKEIFNSSSFGKESFRFGDYFDNVNHIGSYLAIAFVSSLFLVFFHTKKLDFLFVISSAVFAFVGFATGSKAFIISIFISILLFLLIKFWKKKLILLISIIALVLCFVVLINLPFLALLKSRMMSLFDAFFKGSDYGGGSNVQRFLWQEYGLYLGSKQLLFGYGTSGFSIYSGVGTYAHANYAEMLCNYGLIGLLLFYFPIIYLLLYSIKVNGNEIKMVMVFCFIFIAKSFMTVFYYDKATYLIFGLMFYIIISDSENRIILPKPYYCVYI